MLTPNVSEVSCYLLPVKNLEHKCPSISCWICGQTIVRQNTSWHQRAWSSWDNEKTFSPVCTPKRAMFPLSKCSCCMDAKNYMTKRVLLPQGHGTSFSAHLWEKASSWLPLNFFPSSRFSHLLFKNLFTKKDVHWGPVRPIIKEDSFLFCREFSYWIQKFLLSPCFFILVSSLSPLPTQLLPQEKLSKTIPHGWTYFWKRTKHSQRFTVTQRWLSALSLPNEKETYINIR